MLQRPKVWPLEKQYPAVGYSQWPGVESGVQLPLKQKPFTSQSEFTKQGWKPGMFKQKCGGEWPA